MDLKYISPTSYMAFWEDRKRFWERYGKGIKEPQSRPMALGAAFDAIVKGELTARIFGEKGKTAELFEAQVEDVWKKEVWKDGWKVWEMYKRSGALTELLMGLEGCTGVKMEFEICKGVGVFGGVEEIPIMGKPDLYYVKNGKRIVHDWKVNGFYSQASVKRGWVRRWRDGIGAWGEDFGHGECGYYGRRKIEEISEDWAVQLGMYSWLVGGMELGSVHQLAFRRGELSVGDFKGKVGVEKMEEMRRNVREMWRIVKGEWDEAFMDCV